MFKIMRRRILLAVTMLSLALSISGCSGGSDGAAGKDGADGPGGATGAAGADGTGLFKASNKNIAFSTLALSTVGGLPTVNFTLSDGTAPVAGLTTTNLRFYIAELIPAPAATDSEQWHQWIQERDRVGTAFGTFTNLGSGNYRYTFKTPFSSAPSQANLQRLIVRISGVTGFNSVNGDYDFRISAPGTKLASAKDIVTSEACNECHGANLNNYGHGGGYTGTKTCVICHSSALTTTDMAASGFDFVTMIHQIHSKINAKTVFPASLDAKDWSAVAYPGNVLACSVCHKGTQGTNWNTKPTRVGCKSCHTTVKFDGTAYTGIKAGIGYSHTFTTDNNCAFCHGSAYITAKHPLPASYDAAQRTMSAVISGVTVDPGTGVVTATFTVSDGGVAVTDITKFSPPTFILVKLVKDDRGILNWVGYTNQFNTKNVALGLVKQTKGESGGVLVANANGSFSYTFKLITATPAGDIRNVTHAHNVATVAKSGGVLSTDGGDPAYAATVEFAYPVAYEPTKTHRVAMTFSKNATATTAKVDANNAWFDFVPAGGAVTETRQIVKMSDCAKCHANKKLHAAYDMEVCVTCHNPTTKDPYTGETVSIENIVHKLHMGKNLPSVVAGGTYTVNGPGHDYSLSVFPQPISNCLACHNESNTNGANWRTQPTSAACITCHNSSGSLAHGAQNSTAAGESCTVCHAPARQIPVQDAHGNL